MCEIGLLLQIHEHDGGCLRGRRTFLRMQTCLGGVDVGGLLQVLDERRGGRLRRRHAELVLQHQLLLERRIVRPQLLDRRPVHAGRTGHRVEGYETCRLTMSAQEEHVWHHQAWWAGCYRLISGKAAWRTAA